MKHNLGKLLSLIFIFFHCSSWGELITGIETVHINAEAIVCAVQSHRQTPALHSLTAVLIMVQALYLKGTGCSDVPSLSIQAFPTGFHRSGCDCGTIHQFGTCCSKASSVGGRCETGMSVADARMQQSSSRLVQS